MLASILLVLAHVLSILLCMIWNKAFSCSIYVRIREIYRWTMDKGRYDIQSKNTNMCARFKDFYHRLSSSMKLYIQGILSHQIDLWSEKKINSFSAIFFLASFFFIIKKCDIHPIEFKCPNGASLKGKPLCFLLNRLRWCSSFHK